MRVGDTVRWRDDSQRQAALHPNRLASFPLDQPLEVSRVPETVTDTTLISVRNPTNNMQTSVYRSRFLVAEPPATEPLRVGDRVVWANDSHWRMAVAPANRTYWPLDEEMEVVHLEGMPGGTTTLVTVANAAAQNLTAVSARLTLLDRYVPDRPLQVGDTVGWLDAAAFRAALNGPQRETWSLGSALEITRVEHRVGAQWITVRNLDNNESTAVLPRRVMLLRHAELHEDQQRPDMTMTFNDYRDRLRSVTTAEQYRNVVTEYLPEQAINIEQNPTSFVAMRLLEEAENRTVPVDPAQLRHMVELEEENLRLHGAMQQAYQLVDDADQQGAIGVLQEAIENGPTARAAIEHDLGELNPDIIVDFAMDALRDELEEAFTDEGWFSKDDSDQLREVAGAEGYLHPTDDDFYDRLRDEHNMFDLDDLSEIAQRNGYYHIDDDYLIERIEERGYVHEDGLYDRGYRYIDDLEEDGWTPPGQHAAGDAMGAELAAESLKECDIEDLLALPDSLLDQLVAVLTGLTEQQQQEVA